MCKSIRFAFSSRINILSVILHAFEYCPLKGEKHQFFEWPVLVARNVNPRGYAILATDFRSHPLVVVVVVVVVVVAVVVASLIVLSLLSLSDYGDYDDYNDHDDYDDYDNYENYDDYDMPK